MSSQPVFGKRNARSASPTPAHGPAHAPAHGATDAAAIDQAAFFAAARAELGDSDESRPVIVPFSFKAAFLAGVVVGCGLAGFDLTGQRGSAQVGSIASALGLHVEIGGSMLPALILIGLFGGARTVALNLILVHGLLRFAGLTSRLAYTAGGALAAALIATILLQGFGHAPTHGWAIDILAGAAGGLLYRVLAGTRAAEGKIV